MGEVPEDFSGQYASSIEAAKSEHLLKAWLSMRDDYLSQVTLEEGHGSLEKLALSFHAIDLLKDAHLLCLEDRYMTSMPIIRAAFETVTTMQLMGNPKSYGSWIADERLQDRLTLKAVHKRDSLPWTDDSNEPENNGPFRSRGSQFLQAYKDGEFAIVEYRGLTGLCHPSVRLANKYIRQQGDDFVVAMLVDDSEAVRLLWMIYMCLELAIRTLASMTQNQKLGIALLEVGSSGVIVMPADPPEAEPAQEVSPLPGPGLRRAI